MNQRENTIEVVRTIDTARMGGQAPTSVTVVDADGATYRVKAHHGDRGANHYLVEHRIDVTPATKDWKRI
jgi:hypothetical protein